jgi:hypothetical protein
MRNFDEPLRDEPFREDEHLRETELKEVQRKGQVAAFPSQSPHLLAKNESEDMRAVWTDIQTGFVDDPRNAVERADKLVADAIERLSTTFSAERSKLEEQWSKGGEASTEDLRVAIQRYRAFFDRLLSI